MFTHERVSGAAPPSAGAPPPSAFASPTVQPPTSDEDDVCTPEGPAAAGTLPASATGRAGSAGLAGASASGRGGPLRGALQSWRRLRSGDGGRSRSAERAERPSPGGSSGGGAGGALSPNLSRAAQGAAASPPPGAASANGGRGGGAERPGSAAASSGNGVAREADASATVRGESRCWNGMMCLLWRVPQWLV